MCFKMVWKFGNQVLEINLESQQNQFPRPPLSHTWMQRRSGGEGKGTYSRLGLGSGEMSEA